MSQPADSALKSLERLLAHDPALRDLMSGNTPAPRKAGRFNPAVDVVQTPTHYEVHLDVPGVLLADLEVELDGGRLVVRGKRRLVRGEGAKVRMAERGSGTFERTFLLPSQTHGDQVTARLVQGVLTVTVPVGDEGKPRKVSIEG